VKNLTYFKGDVKGQIQLKKSNNLYSLGVGRGGGIQMSKDEQWGAKSLTAEEKEKVYEDGGSDFHGEKSGTMTR